MDTYPSDAPLVAEPPAPPILPPTEPESTPPLPLAKPSRSSPLLPMFLGVAIVVIISSVLAGFYYFSRLKKEVATASPSPTPLVSPSPSLVASSSASATPAASRRPSAKPSTSVKASPTPTPTPTTSATPTPTPVTTTASLDLRYANPAAHIKQTYDDGSSTGRVINREFSSIQIGEFDEVRSAWSPKVTVCFHVVSNHDLEGNKIGYSLTEDDKIVSEGTLSQYSKIEAGKTYDLCHDTTTSLGSHTLRLNLNNTKSFAEATYANNLARLDFKNLADNIAPNFTLAGPYNWNENGTCFLLTYPEDNVTPTSDLKVEHKVDTSDWASLPTAQYCFKGTSGTAHSYRVRLTDARNNQNEQSINFNLY